MENVIVSGGAVVIYITPEPSKSTKTTKVDVTPKVTATLEVTATPEVTAAAKITATPEITATPGIVVTPEVVTGCGLTYNDMQPKSVTDCYNVLFCILVALLCHCFSYWLARVFQF